HDFQKIYKRGKRITTPHLRIFYLPIQGGSSRFGFVIPSKTVKNIVERNRLKRVLRAQLASLVPRLRSGYGVIFLAGGKLRDSASGAIREELTRALSQIGVLRQ
ncbi:MAG: ribonuclease P protein component, partial [Candidatus Doudnabacteria bacterium RIFCSPHIGHO2_01_52_17]